MKYRNFDPNTNQPISAVDLLEKVTSINQLSTDANNPTDFFDLLSKSTPEEVKIEKIPKDEDLTITLLGRYSKIADLINKKSSSAQHGKRKKNKGVGKHRNEKGTRIEEFDKYLESKYPMEKSLTKDKFTKIYNERIKHFISESKTT